MQSAMLTLAACAPILAGWLTAGVCRLVVQRRRGRREDAAWERLTAGLTGLDAKLDRIWAAGQDRTR